MDPSTILRRYKCAEDARNQFRGMYERCYELAAPNKNAYERAAGNIKSPYVFDSTPAIAMDSFVNTMMNTVTPTHTRWADLEAGDGLVGQFFILNGINPSKEEEDQQRKKYNEDLGRITESLFAYMNASNLYSALGSMYYDVGIGTGFLLAMPGDVRKGVGSPLNYRAMPPTVMSIEEGSFGEISAVFRKINERHRDIKQEWLDIKSLGDQEDDEKVELLEATIFNPDIGRWDYFVLHESKIVVKREYRSNPWIVFRWDVISGEIWGRGPMIKALPDAQQLNASREISIRANQLSAFGAYMGISDDIVNTNMVRIVPGAVIPVKRNAGPSGPTLAPLPSVGNINAQLLQIQELEAKIRRLLLDDNLPSPDSPKMTATEVIERVRKIQRDFGAVFGRISYELLQPILQRTFDILVYDRGLIPIPERIAQVYNRIDGFSIKMKIISPIARLQSMQDVESMMQVIQIIGGIDPNMLAASVKLEDLPEWIADKLGAPNRFIRSAQEREDFVQAQQEQAMQQALIQQGPTQEEETL